MLNTNQKQRDKSARKDHALKLGLELVLFKKMLPIFRGISSEFKKTYASTGTILPLDNFNTNLNNVLQTHYADVTDKFNTRIVDEIGKPAQHEHVADRIAATTSNHHSNRAQQSSTIITQTTQKDITESILKSTSDLVAEGKPLTNVGVATKAKLKLDQKIAGRLNTISAVETQNPAEHAKQTEIDTLHWHDAEIDGEKIRDKNVQKQWVAILDNVTRPDHADADGQTIDVNDAYNVGGEQMMFPGDMSLGASIDNVINCRCSSVPIIK